jgi:hypothetical protein
MAIATIKDLGRTQNAAAAGLLALAALAAVASPVRAQQAQQGQSGLEAPNITEPDWMSEPRWVDIGLMGAWNVADRAYTEGPKPQKELPQAAGQAPITLCDDERVGYVAICREGDWKSDPATMPSGVTTIPSDIDGKTEAWCSYKVDPITINTRFESPVTPGRVFVCGRVVQTD